MLRSAEVCVVDNDSDNNDRTNSFTPCTITRGNYMVSHPSGWSNTHDAVLVTCSHCKGDNSLVPYLPAVGNDMDTVTV